MQPRMLFRVALHLLVKCLTHLVPWKVKACMATSQSPTSSEMAFMPFCPSFCSGNSASGTRFAIPCTMVENVGLHCWTCSYDQSNWHSHSYSHSCSCNCVHSHSPSHKHSHSHRCTGVMGQAIRSVIEWQEGQQNQSIAFML